MRCLWLIGLASLMLASFAKAEQVPAPPAGDLYLLVSINAQPTGLIGQFRERADGMLAITEAELNELGLKSDGASPRDDGFIDLDRLPEIRFRYDAARQTLDFTAPERRRIPKRYDAKAARNNAVDAEPATGAVLNYLLYGSSRSPLWDVWSLPRNGGASAALEGRIFSSFGVFSQTAIVSTDNASDGARASVRLNTDWTVFDPETYVTYRAGDLISGGLPWTRPLRLGGVQVQRAFSLRPDLITMPLAGFAGSAAVPSTVEVYVNNVRTFSQQVASGPFEIANLPLVTGPGLQRVVIRDKQGRETVTDRPFYASAKLLREGLSDFSVEAGFRRLNYGLRSDDYQGNPVASGSLRYGVADWLTLEGHAEGDGRLWNGGVGAAFPLSWFGVGTLAFAGSTYNNLAGMQVAASIEMALGPTRIYARTQRTFGDYLDIASLATPDLLVAPGLFINLRPAREIDQLALTLPLLFDRSSMTLSATRLVDGQSNSYDILGATWSRPLGANASVFATAFKDFSDRETLGVFAGVSLSFGGLSANAAVSGGSTALAGGVEVVKPQSQQVGTYGWRLRDREGGEPDRLAAASYRAPFGRIQATAQQFGSDMRVTGELEGSIAMLDGSVFLGNRINDAFAVVDVGAPNVGVFYQNRPMGKTDAQGRLLVPNLRSYERNEFAIDPKDLPVDADIPRTRTSVVPSARGGATVRFDVRPAAPSAIVVLRDAAGALIPVGAAGQVEGGEEFIVGYDGQAFIKGESETAVLVVQKHDGSCRAEIALKRGEEAMTKPIEAVCR